MNKLLRTGLRVLGMAAAGSVAYSIVNACTIMRTEYNVYHPFFKKDFKILFISDVHYGEGQPKTVANNMFSKLVQEEFDLVLLGGDIVSHTISSADLADVTARFSMMKSVHGVYAVYGNHDGIGKGNYRVSDFIEAMTDCGVHILKDEYVVLNAEVPIMLIGRDCHRDYVDGRARLSEIKGSMKDTRGMYTICLDHEPEAVEAVAYEGVDLLLNGHTHGGQLYPVAKFMERKGDYLYGEDIVLGMEHIITSGFGVSHGPFRNAAHCEYVVITVSGLN